MIKIGKYLIKDWSYHYYPHYKNDHIYKEFSGFCDFYHIDYKREILIDGMETIYSIDLRSKQSHAGVQTTYNIWHVNIGNLELKNLIYGLHNYQSFNGVYYGKLSFKSVNQAMDFIDNSFSKLSKLKAFL